MDHPKDGAIALASAVAESPAHAGRHVMPNHYGNPDNVRAHYETTGPGTPMFAPACGGRRYEPLHGLDNLAYPPRRQGRYDEALTLLRRVLALRESPLEAADILRSRRAADHPEVRQARAALVRLYEAGGRPDRAAAFRDPPF